MGNQKGVPKYQDGESDHQGGLPKHHDGKSDHQRYTIIMNYILLVNEKTSYYCDEYEKAPQYACMHAIYPH